MINFVVCFDENYNDEAYLFFHTLLKSVTEKIDIYIVHKNPSSFDHIKEKISSHEKLNKLEIYKFDYDLSTIKETLYGHISEATYYRLFLNRYLPDNLDYILYVDADVICYRDPIPLLKKEIQKLSKSEFIISARTEVFREKKIEPHWERLSLKGERYFNAGVLLIDYQEWLKKDMSKILLEKMSEKKDILLYWDQDLMNMEIDDKYVELSNSLNFDLFIAPDNVNRSLVEHYGQEALDNMCFLHYSGSMKPWTIRAAFNKRSIFYHDAYYELFKKKYKIVNTWKVSAVTQLLNGIFRFYIKNMRYPISFVYIAILSLFKPSKTNE
tara:strand:- start:2597 stop:3574 length:978 start_codon:yes stop_codon:yes gene_type:complete